MPLYDYLCPGCGGEFESLSKPYDPVKCPKCGCYPCERLVSFWGGYTIQGVNDGSQRPNMERRTRTPKGSR